LPAAFSEGYNCATMEIIDLSDEYVATNRRCLEDWSDEMKEAETLKSEWYEKTRVTCFRNGWRPGQNLACERMKRAAMEFGARVEYVEIDTEDRMSLDEWGICDGIFIDDRQISTGLPPSYERLRGLLSKHVR